MQQNAMFSIMLYEVSSNPKLKLNWSSIYNFEAKMCFGRKNYWTGCEDASPSVSCPDGKQILMLKLIVKFVTSSDSENSLPNALVKICCF